MLLVADIPVAPGDHPAFQVKALSSLAPSAQMAVASQAACIAAFTKNSFSLNDPKAAEAAAQLVAKLGISVDEFVSHYDCVGLTRCADRVFPPFLCFLSQQHETAGRKEGASLAYCNEMNAGTGRKT